MIIAIVAVHLAAGFALAVFGPPWGLPRALAASGSAPLVSAPREEAHAEVPAASADALQTFSEEAPADAGQDEAPEPPSRDADEEQQSLQLAAMIANAAAAKAERQAEEEANRLAEAAPGAAIEDIPPQWSGLLSGLEAEGYEPCRSFVEASAHALRLEVAQYRERLLASDALLRRAIAGSASLDRAAFLAELEMANEKWESSQAFALAQLQNRSRSEGAYDEVGQRLAAILAEQAAAITVARTAIRRLAEGEASDTGQLLAQLGPFFDAAHTLRDRLQEALLSIVKIEQRLPAIESHLRVDPATGFKNRAGLEAVLDEWWREDPNRVRQLSAALFAPLGMRDFNIHNGAEAGDRLLAAAARTIDGSLRKKRGFDILFHFDGYRFLVLLGDTGPVNATSAAERFRQAVAATTFEIDGQTARLDLCGAVVETLHDDTSDSLFARLEEVLGRARQAGAGRLAVDDGRGPQLVEDPPSYNMPGATAKA